MFKELNLKVKNNPKLKFDLYFKENGKMEDEDAIPFYFIPCKTTKNEEVIPSVSLSYYIRVSDIILTNNIECFEVEELKKNIQEEETKTLIQLKKFDQKELLLKKINAARELGFNDIIVGYYDLDKKEFIQDIYIDNITEQVPFNLLNYYIRKVVFDYYLNENKYKSKIALMIDNLDYSNIKDYINKEDLKILANKLQKNCLESSFYSDKYKNDILDMNEEIVYYLNNSMELFNPNELIEVVSYLKRMNILDFYIKENEEYKALSKISSHVKNPKDVIMYLGYHPRLIDLLRKKY